MSGEFLKKTEPKIPCSHPGRPAAERCVTGDVWLCHICNKRFVVHYDSDAWGTGEYWARRIFLPPYSGKAKNASKQS